MEMVAPYDFAHPAHPIPVTCGLGTWGWQGLTINREQWCHPDSTVWRYLHTLGLTVRCDRSGRGFTWGTGLVRPQLYKRLFGMKAGIKDWEVGAANFYDYHRPATVEPRHFLRGRNIHALMHSHAGNLPYIACGALGLRMNVLVTVSTPIRMDVLDRWGPIAKKNIGWHIHYWSKGDRIQRAGELGDGRVDNPLTWHGDHPFADENICLDHSAGHTGLLQDPFQFTELLTFVEQVHRRHNNPGYLDNRLWTS